MLARSLSLALLTCLGLSLSASYAADSITGIPKVMAGNIIEIEGQRYFLNGLAVPTSDKNCVVAGESCAAHAKRALTALIAQQTINCVRQETSYGSLPTVACEFNGNDLSTLAAAKGIALPFAENDFTRSAAESASATQAGLLASPVARSLFEGLKSGSAAPRDCLIKGNISRQTGKKIYHLPGAAHYDRTLINLTRGERWFCNEEDAQALGFRKAAN